MSLGTDDLILCAGSLADAPLVERARAAAAAGFTGLSLFIDDLVRVRADGHSDADVRTLLTDLGLQVAELDPLLRWLPDGNEDATGDEGFLRYGEADFYRAAEAVGARSLNAVSFGSRRVPHEKVVEAFAGLCDRAAEHGLLVHLEFMPFSQIRDVDDALAVVEEANRPNGGIMFDVWHHFRGAGSDDSLRRAAAKVFAVQLDDAPGNAESNLIDETLHRRLVPGEGDADVVNLIRILDLGGCRAPLGVEVFSDDLAKLPTRDAALRIADATRRVVREARS